MAVKLDPYLNFPGTTREAMEFYQTVFGGELVVQTFADFGAPVSDSYKDKVMHARLEASTVVLMASDPQEGGGTPVVGDNVNLSLIGGPDDAQQLTTVFDALADGGTTSMPLSEAPWGATFGMTTDRFGVNWLVNIDKGEGDGAS